MKVLGYGLLALGALALLSAVLLPAEFDYQDAYDGAGASRRLMLGIFGGVVFIGGTILVAAQSILDGLRRPSAPVTGAAPAPSAAAVSSDMFAYPGPAATKPIDRPMIAGPAGIRPDRSGNSLLIAGVTIVGLAAILVVITLAVMMLRDEREVATYGNVIVEANVAVADPDTSLVDSQLWAPANDATGTVEGPAPTLPPVSEGSDGLDKVVPGLDRLPVRRTEPAPEPEAPEAARREAPARRAAPATREDPFADPPAASDDPFAD